MSSYLADGWFQSDGKRGLRTEIIDGAMDVAGMLNRARIPTHTVMRLALKVRALVAVANPQLMSVTRFSDRERGKIQARLDTYADTSPELYAFTADCVEQIENVRDLMAFYLHLVHVARMMQLLDHAQHDSAISEHQDGSASDVAAELDSKKE